MAGELQLGGTTLATHTGSGASAKINLDSGLVFPAGHVIQVVNAATTTPVTISSTGLVDTGLSVSITPTKTSSKILVLTKQGGYVGRDNSLGFSFNVRLVKDSTIISTHSYDFRGGLASDGRLWAPFSDGFCTMDSPNTTSAITYKTQGDCSTTANAAGIRFQYGATEGSMVLMEIVV